MSKNIQKNKERNNTHKKKYQVKEISSEESIIQIGFLYKSLASSVKEKQTRINSAKMKESKKKYIYLYNENCMPFTLHFVY